MAQKIKVTVTEVHEATIVGGKYPMQNFLGKTEETDPKYAKTIFFTLLGEKAVSKAPKVGEIVNVSYDILSREWNGRWFTDIRAYDIEVVQGVVMAPNPEPAKPTQSPQPPQPHPKYAAQVVNMEATIEHGSDADTLPF